MEHLWWPYVEHIKTARKGFCEEVLGENDFEAVLATFRCYGYGADACETLLESSL